ncbi:MAG: peptide chain release factor 3 [Deltaproteobacteria bacterium]|nr:peptide chain release factor 3 [Deltaproteobacteria bacterium]
MSSVAVESQKRRTFAIISHPDAGKTTVTEKLLLYAGAIHLAGSVKARKNSRHAISDWMKMEQERGISVTSSVLQFGYKQAALNLLDTPGHADFSEDTYRTLAAVDSAIMLIDHAKGVEARTLRLFEVCRMRKLPVVTFMNKLDREGRDPLDLLDDVSKSLNIEVAPLNWPIGNGRDFKGVIDIRSQIVHLFAADSHGSTIAKVTTLPFVESEKLIGTRLFDETSEQLELLAAAGTAYNRDSFMAGEVSPVFWGSALTNFGVGPLLDFIAAHAAPPAARIAEDGNVINPNDERFSGFIFKIQANMNPRHRDRIAFLRVVSGRFSRGMETVLGRSGDKLKLAKPHSFMAQERSIVDEAWPGDIVGLYDSGQLRIGDTLCEGAQFSFSGIPRFAPEYFAQLVVRDAMKRKAVDSGLSQLSHEGVIQLFYNSISRQEPYLGAVGQLQFEVLKERLKNEYGADVAYRSSPYRWVRWIGGEPEGLKWLKARRDYAIMQDRNGRPVLLAESQFSINYALENAPGLVLYDIEPL